jgi:hypothetical protein
VEVGSVQLPTCSTAARAGEAQSARATNNPDKADKAVFMA